MHQEFIKYIKSHKPNEFIIKEGEENEAFFCLLQGKVAIWKGPPEDKDKMIKVGELSEKGTYFGEMNCLLHEARTASIIAMEPVKVLRFPGEMLPQMLIKQPKLGLKLCTALADRLKGTTDQQRHIAEHRNEIREDATVQTLHAKEQYQKIFVMITAVQKQLQHPLVKNVVEYMSHDKLLQGGRRIRLTEQFMADVPDALKDPIKNAYADKLK